MSSIAVKPVTDSQILGRLLGAMILSFLLHLCLLLGISLSRPSPQPHRIEVALLPRPPAPKEIAAALNQPMQIVTPSEAPEKKPEKDTNLLSDRDASTPIEKIRRGLPEPERPKENTSVKAQAPNPPAPSLRLNEKTLEKEFGQKPVPVASDSNGLLLARRDDNSRVQKTLTDAERAQQFSRYEPFRRSQSVFSFRQGSPDYLPTVEEGDITLLNTKADQFAVFVRRVALQVFGNLRRRSWEDIPYQELLRLTNFVTVHAVMSKQGQLISVKLVDSSGSSHFDKILVTAATSGTVDRNPPAEAAGADGNIHFLFKSRSWVRASPNGLNEQRWLLLGTGLL